jgi:small-conductance mechanosensitive channel
MLTRLSLLLVQSGDPERFMEVFRESFRDVWPEIAGRAPRTIVAFGIFIGFVVLAFILRRALKTALSRTAMAPRIRILVARMAVISTLVLGGLIFLVIVTEASLGRVITGFGLLSVGVGLALKSPLENMVSGIMTILVAPFRIGDEIEVSGYAGRVEDISIHDTILRTFDGKRVAIPNVDVYLNPVVNQTAYPLRRYDVIVGIHYNDDMPKAMEIAQESLDSTEGVRETPEPVVLAETLNEYSVDMILRFWSEPSMQNQFKVISDVTTSVKLAFDREGITIPFPIRTFHIPDDEAKGAGELQIRVTDESSNSDGKKE